MSLGTAVVLWLVIAVAVALFLSILGRNVEKDAGFGNLLLGNLIGCVVLLSIIPLTVAFMPAIHAATGLASLGLLAAAAVIILLLAAAFLFPLTRSAMLTASRSHRRIYRSKAGG